MDSSYLSQNMSLRGILDQTLFQIYSKIIVIRFLADFNFKTILYYSRKGRFNGATKKA